MMELNVISVPLSAMIISQELRPSTTLCVETYNKMSATFPELPWTTRKITEQQSFLTGLTPFRE
jgi:hypothetical protein